MVRRNKEQGRGNNGGSGDWAMVLCLGPLESRLRFRPPTHFRVPPQTPYPLPVPVPQKAEETKEGDMTPGQHSDRLSKAGNFGEWGGTECLRLHRGQMDRQSIDPGFGKLALPTKEPI